jgi:hypothetical protein
MGFRLSLAGSWRRILILGGGRRFDFGLCVLGLEWGIGVAFFFSFFSHLEGHCYCWVTRIGGVLLCFALLLLFVISSFSALVWVCESFLCCLPGGGDG